MTLTEARCFGPVVADRDTDSWCGRGHVRTRPSLPAKWASRMPRSHSQVHEVSGTWRQCRVPQGRLHM